MKRRIIAIGIALVMALSLAACAGKSSEPSSATEETSGAPGIEETTTEETAEESETAQTSMEQADSSAMLDYLKDVKPERDLQIGLSLGHRDEFGSKLEAAIVAEAERLGVKIVTVDANNSSNTQMSHIQQFSGQGVDAIVAKLVTTDMGPQVIKAAEGIPVAFVNITPVEDLTGTGCTKVGSRETEAGKFQGDFIGNYFKEKGAENVRYVMMRGTLGLSFTTDRSDSAEAALKAIFPNAEMVHDDTGEYDRAKAQNKMQTFLGTNREFDCVFANNDEMAIGCVLAMRQSGLDTGEILVVGIDGTPNGLDSMADGGLAMTVYQDANKQGQTAIQAAIAMANGDEVDAEIVVPFLPITPDNMEDFR